MARKYYIAVLISLLLSSCAQVGIISGGEVDRNAPKPVAENVVPLNESTNFQGNSVEIPFDEFFRLMNPVQNIRMVPPHATIVATVKGKTLNLSWEETLEPNTTYAIYLNNAVRDLTEGNDSIIQYAFSTGDILDTLSYSVLVMDAWTSKPIDDCIVALYQPMTNKLVSFAQPSLGIAQLNYLRPGTYKIVAFKDENNDLELQDYEMIGFPETGKAVINASWFDSVPIRMSIPEADPKITTLKFVPPCSFVLAANKSMRGASFYENGIEVFAFEHDWFSDDSVKLLIQNLEAPSTEFIVKSELFTDTIKYHYKPKEREEKISIKALNQSIVAPGKMPSFYVNGYVSGYDSTLIHIQNPEDSSEITDFSITHDGFGFELVFDITDLKEAKIIFDTGAIITSCGTTEAFKSSQTINSESDYGILNVDVAGYTDPIIVDLLQRKKVVSSKAIKDPSSPLVLTQLFPGEYTFRIIRDTNGNGVWDVGEYSTLSQPEQVDVYSKKTKVKANWTIDVTLTPTH